MTAEGYRLRSARYLAADALARALRPGDVAVDATMGNGHDTLALCELVGETGRVYAFDVQPQALQNTRARLEAAGCLSRARLILAGHEEMGDYVKERAQAVAFNLGWLPGAAHGVTTRTQTTLAAVSQALDLLAPGGIVTVCIYPGHEEGKRELDALLAWAKGLDVRQYSVLLHSFLNAPEDTPRLLVVQDNAQRAP